MLKRVLFYLTIASLTIDLTGCATIQKHNIAKQRRSEYLRSDEAAPLRVPFGLNAAGAGDDYIVPASAAAAPTQPIGILPPDSMADKLARGVINKDALKTASKFADAKNAVPAAAITAAPNQPAMVAASSVVNNNVLPLNQAVSQAWKAVGTAMTRQGYKIALADEKMSTYYILDMHATDERVTKATPMYQIKLQSGADNNAYAQVNDENGGPVNAETSQRILTDLSNGLAGKSSGSFKQMLAPVKQWFKEAL